MRYHDVEAAKAVVTLDGVHQKRVIEATPGDVGHVRKHLVVNGNYVMDCTGRGLAEVVEYGVVKVMVDGKEFK